jgi:hypothetical protein
MLEKYNPYASKLVFWCRRRGPPELERLHPMTTPDFSAKLGQRVAPNLFILKRLPAAIRSALTFIAQLRENVVAHEKTPNVLKEKLQ